MSGDGISGVSVILAELDLEALAAGDLMALHAAEELSRLPRKHRANDQLNVTFELGQCMVLRAVWRRVVGLRLLCL
jgi:hypothetical protein